MQIVLKQVDGRHKTHEGRVNVNLYLALIQKVMEVGHSVKLKTTKLQGDLCDKDFQSCIKSTIHQKES